MLKSIMNVSNDFSFFAFFFSTTTYISVILVFYRFFCFLVVKATHYTSCNIAYVQYVLVLCVCLWGRAVLRHIQSKWYYCGVGERGWVRCVRLLFHFFLLFPIFCDSRAEKIMSQKNRTTQQIIIATTGEIFIIWMEDRILTARLEID